MKKEQDEYESRFDYDRLEKRKWAERITLIVMVCIVAGALIFMANKALN